MKQAVKQYIDAFNDELESFKDRIRERAKIRIQEAMKEVEQVIPMGNRQVSLGLMMDW